MIELPPFDHHRTVEAIAQCGVSASRVRIRREHELDTVTIGRLNEAPSEKLFTCIYEATIPAGYDVQFADPSQNADFWNLTIALGMERGRLEARQWLRDRGILDGLPMYDPGISSPATFARQVETYCSFEPGSVLTVVNETLFTVRNSFLHAVAGSKGAVYADRFTCLMKVLAASNLAEGGLRFGFVGDEAGPDQGASR